MRARGYGQQVLAVNDAIGGLRAASLEGTGVIVVCGTGTATGARAPDGRTWHSGFWQEAEGSQDLANRALRAVYRADLGLEQPTSLSARVLSLLGESRVEDVLHRYTARQQPPVPARGLIVRLLLDEAASGDPVAERIVRDHGAALADIALVAARRVGIGPLSLTVYLAGGVLQHPSSVLQDAIAGSVRVAAPQARVVRSRLQPAMGTLMLALEAAGVAIDVQMYERLGQHLPTAALFAS